MQKIIPYLSYLDGAEAIDWLCRTFGFTETLRYEEVDGTVSHAELALGGDVVFLSTDPRAGDGNAPHESPYADLVWVEVPDVGTHYVDAVSAGATIVTPPEDEPYGVRRYRVLDLAGRTWIFCQRVDNVDPETWGAKAHRAGDVAAPRVAPSGRVPV